MRGGRARERRARTAEEGGPREQTSARACAEKEGWLGKKGQNGSSPSLTHDSSNTRRLTRLDDSD